jgi:hypothetical protein
LAKVIWFVNRSEYKTPSFELEDLRRGKRYPASRTGWVLLKEMRYAPGRPDPYERGSGGRTEVVAAEGLR